MPYTVEFLPNLPVIHVKYAGQTTKDEIIEAMRDVIQQALTLTTPKIFHVIDVTDAQTDFMAMMGVFKEMLQNAPRIPMPNHHTEYHRMFVGSNDMAKLSAQMMTLPQFGGMKIPVFKSLDDALRYVRQELGILETSE